MSTTQAVTPGVAGQGRGPRGRVERLLTSEYLVLALTAVYFAAMWAIVPEIASRDTLLDILAAMIPLLVVAIGQTFVLIVAGIDLSAPSILAAASVVGASMMTGEGGFALGTGVPILVGVATFLLSGLFIGLLNGVCVTRLGMPPFIVTLTTMMFFAGFALFYTSALTDDGSSFGDLPSGFVAIGQGTVRGVPYSLAVAVVVMGVAHLILSRTVFGQWLYAIGRNPKAAAISGVPVRRTVMWAFVISGLCAGIASVLYTGRLETGTPVLGQRILLDIVGSAVIGGVSLFGGKGRVTWTLYGVLFLSVVDKGLQLLGLSLASVFAIKGLVILTAAVLDALRHRLALRG
jgi:ribose/xylose/arabinose/galactoside ABC-type transport system permease subunit